MAPSTRTDPDNTTPMERTEDRPGETVYDPRQWEFLQTVGTQGLRTLAGALGIDSPNLKPNNELATEIAQRLGAGDPALTHRPDTGDNKPNT